MKSITAAELQAQLQKDPEYQRNIREREAEIEKEEAELRKDEKPLIKELVSFGFNISSSWELVNTSAKYEDAIPVLVKHLSKPYHKKNKEGIVRALAVKEAKGIACKVIIEEYHKAPKDDFHYRWAFGNTMAVIITEEHMDDVIEIVQDEENGESRDMFVRALGKVKSSKVEQVLIDLLDDDEVSPHAIEALGKLKSQKAKTKINELVGHKKSLIRKEAQKALKKIK